MATFGPKAWVNPFGKTSIFSLFELLVFGIERRFFVLEYRKRHFPGLYYLKKKVRKMVIFGPKPWVNFLGKMSIFRFFCTSFSVSLVRRFFVVEYRNRHFPGLYCLKKICCKNGHLFFKTVGSPLWKNVNFSTF